MQQQPCMETLIRKGRKQAEGTHRTKALLICNNRRATAADKKVAALLTSGNLIKRQLLFTSLASGYCLDLHLTTYMKKLSHHEICHLTKLLLIPFLEILQLKQIKVKTTEARPSAWYNTTANFTLV